MPEGQLIQLPLQHYLDRYRKAYADLAAVNALLAQLKGQRAGLSGQIKYFEQQHQMLYNEIQTAELAMRSAIIVGSPLPEASVPLPPGIPEAVVAVLKSEQLESLQPKPDPEAKIKVLPDPEPDKGAS